jgi:3-deoxy-D-manno-octulosonic-acid transferase
MENFASLRDALCAAGGAIEVRDAATLAAETARLWSDPQRAERLIAAANQALLPHRGATERTAKLVEEVVMGSDSAALRV